MQSLKICVYYFIVLATAALCGGNAVELDTASEECPVEVTIQRLDASVRSDTGEVMGEAYYDLPVLSGSLESCSKINDYFVKESEKWTEETGHFHCFWESAYENFLGDTEWGRATFGEEHMAESPFRYTVDTRIEFVNDQYLSAMQMGYYRTGGRSTTYFFGHTFDLEMGELLPINAFLDTDADSLRDMIITVLEEYEDSMCLTDCMEDLNAVYGKNENSDYDLEYEEVSSLLNYEYYYDGEYFYIILNDFFNNSGGCLLKWNGKYGDERESVMMNYIMYCHEIMRKEYGVDGSDTLEKMDW